MNYIDNIPFPELTQIYSDFTALGSEKDLKENLEKFSDKWKILNKTDWLFPQMLAKFSDLPLTRKETGLISGKNLFLEIRKSPFYSGMWVLCTQGSRGLWVPRQTDPKNVNFSALVPLIMSAFKKYKDIQYSEWDREEIKYITDATLTEAMLTELPKLTPDEVLEARRKGLVYKSGPRIGESRNPMTTYALYIPNEYGLSDLNALSKIMLCQTWVAHPANRTKYMITSSSHWDQMPEPLIDTTVLLKNTENKSAPYLPKSTEIFW